jgi:hypothetical protein
VVEVVDVRPVKKRYDHRFDGEEKVVAQRRLLMGRHRVLGGTLTGGPKFTVLTEIMPECRSR